MRLSVDSDLLVMGGKTGDFIELLFSKSLVREITEQVKCPVLWLKEFEERESFFLSLFKTQKNKGGKIWKQKVQDQFIGLADNIVAYLPNLLAGIVLIFVGWLAGWLIKRVLVQISILLRIDRFIRRSRWETDFAKADVRFGLYNFIGNIGYTLVFLLFLTNALDSVEINYIVRSFKQGAFRTYHKY